MNRNTERGIAGILIALIIIFAAAIVGSPLVSTSPSSNSHSILQIQPTPTNAEENAIQLKPFIPSSAVSTVTPTIPVTYNSNIPFTDPGLDWDDIQPLVAKCGNVSPTCQQQAIQGVHTELGDVDLSSSTPGFKPGSRVYICYYDAYCHFNGFSAYHSSPPLPTFTPSSDCVAQFQACLQSEVPNLHQTCPEIFDTNCDASDSICGANAPTCSSE